jgi:aspartate aminotransferase
VDVTKFLYNNSILNPCFRLECLQTMVKRLKMVRQGLKERLEKLGTPGDWNHITTQTGMFSFTGLTSK